MFRTSVVRFVLLFTVLLVTCVNSSLLQNARLQNPTGYFSELMQDTMLEVERRGWSSLKLVDITKNMNTLMYDWHVQGTVTYKNGFLLSIQSIDVTEMTSSIGNRAVSGAQNIIAIMSGRLNLRDVTLAYDVVSNLTDGVHHHTGTFTHTLVQYSCLIEKNLNLNTTNTNVNLSSLSGGFDRMQYMPIDSLAGVLSRDFKPYDNWDGVEPWGERIFVQIMLDVANKKPFPEMCFNNC